MFVHDLMEGRPRRRRYVFPPPPAASSGSGIDGGGITYVHLLGIQEEEEEEEEETINDIHCGKESGLGLAWEVNVQVPDLVSWPNSRVPRGAVLDDLVDVLTHDKAAVVGRVHLC